MIQGLRRLSVILNEWIKIKRLPVGLLGHRVLEPGKTQHINNQILNTIPIMVGPSDILAWVKKVDRPTLGIQGYRVRKHKEPFGSRNSKYEIDVTRHSGLKKWSKSCVR